MALKGALDAEYKVSMDMDKNILVEATKMKDAELSAPLAFKLRTVELGLTDPKGREVTSAVLNSIDPDSVKGNPQDKKKRIVESLSRGLRQTEIAKLIGCSPGYVGKIKKEAIDKKYLTDDCQPGEMYKFFMGGNILD